VPLIAEDLGLLTPDVPALLAATGLPGMRVAQFGFGGGDDNLNLPRNYPEACAAYTGTHDNDTAIGWFAAAPAHVRAHALAVVGGDGSDIAWDLIRAVSSTDARYAIVPMQDVLRLGGEARMNTPAVADGQWRWRCAPGAATAGLAAALAAIALRDRRA
jgi:4-alpha-glucanotransferase